MKKFAAIVIGLFGFWFVLSSVVGFARGLWTRNVEFINNLSLLLIIYVATVLFGIALLIGAWKLWKTSGPPAPDREGPNQ